LIRLTATAYFDFLQQLSSLMRDPIAYGRDLPAGDGRPVLLVPGFTAGDWSLAPMAQWLRRIGYRPYLSGIDFNVGCPRQKIERLEWRVEKIARETNDRVTIIGHSLGGLLARATAATKSDQVRHVIGLGSPIRNGSAGVHDRVRPTLEAIQSFFQTFTRNPENCGTPECACGFASAGYLPMPRGTRFSAIYTRSDEVVQWESCIDERGTSHEVSGLHGSLIVNREVYRIIGTLLGVTSFVTAAA